MTPIGILTRDRVGYLDVTLKSLSASYLPDTSPLVVFDDASEQSHTEAYYTGQAVPLQHTRWPKWHNDLGIDPVIKTAGLPQGIGGLVTVVRLSTQPLGVVNGSCLAICQMFERYPEADGVFLLQDDVIVNADWCTRMLEIANDRSLFDRPLGLLAGIKLNQRVRFTGSEPKVINSGITAQCLYMPREAYAKLLPLYLQKHHTIKKRFDDTFRRAVSDAGFWAGTIYPYCCQHIGAVSIVRPGKQWQVGSKGRVGYYAAPPYAIGTTVRPFPW
jgi:hypothetical protein